MITLKQWMEIVNYKITEGSVFQWSCYGSKAYALDSLGNMSGHSTSIIFDTVTQEVYEVQTHDYLNNHAYRMINPDYVDAYRTEATKRNCPITEAWEDVNYVDLELDQDWCEKATAIANGQPYDTGVMISIDFSDEDLLKYMMMAHERNVTFNDFVNTALADFIEHRNQGEFNDISS